MRKQLPLSLITLWQEQVRQKAHTWNFLTIPIVIMSVFVSLWLLALAFGGAIEANNPLALLACSILMIGLMLAGRWAHSYIQSVSIQRNPLLQQTSMAVSRIEQTIAANDTREPIVAVLREELSALFAPRPLETVLYQPEPHHYHVSTTNQAFAFNAPFVEWLTAQPVNVPIVLPAPLLPASLAGIQAEMMERGILLVAPLGRSGWVGLGTPESAAYDDIHKKLLQYLLRPVSERLERIRVRENQQKRAEELRSLYWIAQAVNFSMQLDDLMELVYTQLKRVMALPVFYLALRDQDADTLSYAFYIEDDERLYPKDTWPVDEGLPGVVLRTSKTLRTDNYVEACRQRGLQTNSDTRLPVGWMATPLTSGDKSTGVMVATAYTADITFTEEEENFFVTVAAYTASILERHTLYERLAARARQLGTLNEIGNLLASSLDLRRVLELVVRSAARLLDSEAGSLLLLDQDSGELVFEVASGPVGADLIGLRMPSDKGIAGAAFTGNRPVITQNTREDQRWYDSFDKKGESAPTHFVTESIIAAPLNARGRTIGVLEVLNRKDNRAFDNEDSDLLIAFGAQAALAIENARLFTMTDQALQARLEELTTLQLIDRQLNATLDYGAVMAQTLEWAVRMTHTEIGVIGALQEEEDGTKGLRLLAHQGYDEEIFRRYSEEELWPLKKGLIGYTIQIGETCLVTNVTDNPYYERVVPGMQAQLSVPIKREDHVIGVIALESTQSDTFRKEDVALIERLADHAAIAIENARLFGQVQRANEAKTEFVSFVSHELKQPMTSMKGYTDLLMKGIGGALNDQQKQFIQVIRNNVGRMDQLVQSLLDISRIESGRLRLEMSEVAPEELISEAVQAFEPTISAKNQTIEVNIEVNLPAVTGDRVRLLQVLTNLVSNANKYTPEGGVVTIHAARWMEGDQNYVRWSVQDTGIGMTPEEQERLFTKYFRASSAAVRSVQGTGLGLVITRSIIEMHGGRIWVESEHQKGSTFSFIIPVKDNRP